MPGHYCWTCNIQTTRSYRTIGLSNSDIVLIPNTPYKTLPPTNCMYQHHRLNTTMLNHSLPYVRPYTDRQHRSIELNCSPWQYIYPQIRLFGIATRMFYRLLYLQYNCPDNCSEHHWRNTLHPYIVTDRYALLMSHRLNNIHWTQYNEHRRCNNSCFHRTRIVRCVSLTFHRLNNIRMIPYCVPGHWTIRYMFPPGNNSCFRRTDCTMLRLPSNNTRRCRLHCSTLGTTFHRHRYNSIP